MSWKPTGPGRRILKARTGPMFPPQDIPVDGLWCESWDGREHWWRRQENRWVEYEPTDREQQSHHLLMQVEVQTSYDQIAETMGRSFTRMVPRLSIGGARLVAQTVRTRWHNETGEFEIAVDIVGPGGPGTYGQNSFVAKASYPYEDVMAATASTAAWRAWVEGQWSQLAKEYGFDTERTRVSGITYEAHPRSYAEIAKGIAVQKEFWDNMKKRQTDERLAAQRAEEEEVLKILLGDS